MNKWVITLCCLAPTLVGAKGNGCSTEYQQGDGRDEAWELGELPSAAGEDQPMSCEWLESNNCWKQFAAEAMKCAPGGAGEFDDEQTTCSFPDGSRLELAGPISEPPEGTTHFPIVNHRIVAPSGEACFTAKILGIGRHAYQAGELVLATESTSLTTFRIICPDGSSFANDVEGTCSDFGFRWLLHRAPGYTLTCEGSDDACESEIWAANADGGNVIASCDRDAAAGGAGGSE